MSWREYGCWRSKMKRLDTNPGLRMHGRLALMALTAILPLWIAIGIYAYQSYHSQRERLFEQALDMARIVSQRVDGELNGIMSALRALSTSPALVSGDLATLHHQAEILASFYPTRNAIILIDDQGQLIMSTTRPFGSPLPRVGQPEVKAALKQATDAAVARGVFGAPTCFVGEQMFFGQDRLEFVAQALG